MLVTFPDLLQEFPYSLVVVVPMETFLPTLKHRRIWIFAIKGGSFNTIGIETERVSDFPVKFLEKSLGNMPGLCFHPKKNQGKDRISKKNISL